MEVGFPRSLVSLSPNFAHVWPLWAHLGMHNLKKEEEEEEEKEKPTHSPPSKCTSLKARLSRAGFISAPLISHKATPSDGVDFQYRPDKTCLKFGIIIFTRMCVTNSDYARRVGRGERSLRPRILTYFADVSSRV